MKKYILSLLLFLFIPPPGFSQDNLQVIGELRYGQWDGVWYSVVNGQYGAKADTEHIVARLKDSGFLESFDFSTIGAADLSLVRDRLGSGFYKLRVPESANPFDILKRLHDSGLFANVHLNIYGEITAVPDDDYYPDSWNLPRINTPQAWDLTTGSSQVVVAVIDLSGYVEHIRSFTLNM